MIDPVSERASPSYPTNNQVSVLETPLTEEMYSSNTDELIKWSQTIGRNFFVWDGKDLFVKSETSSKKLGVFSRIAENYCLASRKGAEKNCFCGNSMGPIAIVGSIVAVDHESDFSCQGSYLSWRFASFDLEKLGDLNYSLPEELNSSEPVRSPKGKLVSLEELFSDEDIFSAFMANEPISEMIAEAINERKLEAKPKDLIGLTKFLTRENTIFLDGFFQLEKDYLTRFVFHHIEGEKVAVWISLTPNSHVGQANHEHLEIFLPIPEKFRNPLLLAEAGKEGFLMKDAAKFVGTSHTEFDFDGSKIKIQFLELRGCQK